MLSPEGMKVVRSRSRRALFLACCAGLWIAGLDAAFQSRAAAQAPETGYRLGLMQLETDAMQSGKLSPMLMQALRDTLSQRSDYEMVDTHVTLTQLSLAEDCNVTESSCLGRIADKLKLDGFVFGKLTHDAGEAPMASFRRYDKAERAIRATALVSFGTGAVDAVTEARVQERAQQIVDKLLGPVAEAMAKTTPNASGQAARADAIDEVAAANGDERLLLKKVPDSGLNTRKFAGYVLLGGAAASVGLSVLSIVKVDNASNNASFQDYRLKVGTSNATVTDVCDEASAEKDYGTSPEAFREVKSSCKTGSTFEILQYVFIGSALVTGGLATFLLIGGDDSKDSQKSGLSHITLHPNIGRGGASVTAKMRF